VPDSHSAAKQSQAQWVRDTRDRKLPRLLFPSGSGSLAGAQMSSSVTSSSSFPQRCHCSSPAPAGPQLSVRTRALSGCPAPSRTRYPHPFASHPNGSASGCSSRGREVPEVWQVLRACQVSPPPSAPGSQASPSRGAGESDAHGHCCSQTTANAASAVTFLTERWTQVTRCRGRKAQGNFKRKLEALFTTPPRNFGQTGLAKQTPQCCGLARPLRAG